jgi:predicted Zn-dependent peptidase
MRTALVHLALPVLLGTVGAAQAVRLPAVFERSLDNGMKVLVVERPGSGAIHARLFIRGGRANTGGLPPVAADLLARTLFRRALPEALEARLEPVLEQEGGTFEALRLGQLAQARDEQGDALAGAPDQASLKALEENAMARLHQLLGGVETWDGLDALGATSRDLTVTADFLAQGMDLPAPALLPWCALEAARLRRLPLGRFPLERDRLIQEIAEGAPPSPASLSVLLAMALSGRPYALAAELHRSQVEALGWKELQTYARWAVSPENLTLVLVGDVKGGLILPQLERLFGTLPRAAGSQAHWEGVPLFQINDAVSALESPAGRRLLVSTTGDTRVFFGWRIPPANHPDGSALRALAQILGGAPSSRLNLNLVDRGIARRLTVRLGVPGRRDVNLLVIEAEPGEGHSLDELEQAIQDEILRLQREPLTDLEVRQAQVQLEAGEVLVQEDAATLAAALGAAQCQGGDWRLAFRALEAGGNLKAVEIQRVARTYLVPSRATIAQLGPDPLLVPMDRTESRLLQVLTALLARKLGNSAQAQTVLREALRQLRMLSPDEREQTLKLLETQVQP